jgi:insulysin
VGRGRFLFKSAVIISFVYGVFTGAFAQTTQDARMRTESFSLPNGIQGIAVSIPRAKLASIGVSLPVGYFDDPAQHPGLAHYLEHMLFMGSSKFPSESEYRDFVETRGGNSNAFTSKHETNYQLSLPPKYMSEGLERFSDFFKAPLFDESFLEREKTAVHNEFQNYLQNDGWRFRRIMHLNAGASHPISKFWVGNLESLKNAKKADLQEFYNKHYGADHMKIAITGPQSTSELVKLATAHFSEIPRRNIEPAVFLAPEPQDLPRQIEVMAATEEKSLDFYFTVKQPTANWMRKEIRFLVRLLNKKHIGSLYSILTEKELISDVSAWDANYPGFSFVSIRLKLTDKGTKDLGLLKRTVFGYIQFLKSNATQATLVGLLADFERSTARAYKELELSSDASEAGKLASLLLEFGKGDELLKKSYIGAPFSQNAFKQLLGELSPQKLTVLYMSDRADLSEKCPVWKIPYSVTKMSVAETRNLEEAPFTEEMKFPTENPYEPKSFDMLVATTDQKLLELPTENRGALFLLRSAEYAIPKVYSYFDLRSDLIKPTESSEAVKNLLTQVLKQYLSDWLAKIENSGQSFSVVLGSNSLSFSMVSYPGTSQPILRDYLNGIKHFGEFLSHLEPSVLETFKGSVVDSIHSKKIEDPYLRSIEVASLQLIPQAVDDMEIVDEVRAATVVDLVAQWHRLMSSFGVESLVYGNIDRGEAQALYDQIFLSLQPEKTVDRAAFQSLKAEAVSIRESFANRTVVASSENSNSSFLSFYELGPRSARNSAIMLVLDKLVGPSYFGELRSRQQLGYIVQAGGNFFKKFVTLQALIQSSQKSADDLEKASYQFLRDFADRGLPPLLEGSSLENTRYALHLDLDYKGATSAEFFEWLKTSVLADDGDLDRSSKVAKELDSLSSADIVRAMRELVTPGRPGVLTVKINGQSKGSAK